ncbi:MAG: phosphopentomutase [Candidatus Eremiobacteraeota bacterium]|nr:phosphopentomutase [Candidatus Eremiobacteraeota bacterium]
MRVVTIVIDSGGVGSLPDYADYGDAPGADTLANVARSAGGIALPFLEGLGLGLLAGIRGVARVRQPRAQVARLRPRSRGKDSVTGHWEMAGIVTEVPFPTYPHGFPRDVVERFAAICGREPLGNTVASGTEIIERLGAEHLATGRPILYTSADSVFQVAAHERIVPLPMLYAWCEAARAMLVAPHNVNRIIARPFVGEPGSFARTPNRRDYAIVPPPNVLDTLTAAGVPVHAVGKISDIFCGRGIASSVRVQNDGDAMAKTLDIVRTLDGGFVFTNLNDFDSKYGHRRDAAGYAAALQQFDAELSEVERALAPGDRLIVTADHGCDPTAPGTDHTREFVPFLHLGPHEGAILGDLDGLDTVGKAVLSAFGAA